MTEPDVALTDYVLTLECTVFAWLAYRRPARETQLHAWLALFFASAAAASLCAGTVHGFFREEASVGHTVLWRLSLLAIGVSALSGCVIGARITLRPEVARWVIGAAFLQLAAYAGVILLVNDAFWIAIADYLPAALFLLITFAIAARRHGRASVSLGSWGLALILVAAALQQLRIGVHPVYLNHNSLYHALQAVALALIFIACQRLLPAMGGPHADTT